MKKLKKGDLLIPKEPGVWGQGIITEPERLLYPVAHLVYWFDHNREIIIEEQQIFRDFDVMEDVKFRNED